MLFNKELLVFHFISFHFISVILFITLKYKTLSVACSGVARVALNTSNRWLFVRKIVATCKVCKRNR